MSDSVRVYLNAHGVDVPKDATVLEAIRLTNAAEAARIDAGERAVTDSRGIAVAADTPVYMGAIYRTVHARHHGDAPAE